MILFILLSEALRVLVSGLCIVAYPERQLSYPYSALDGGIMGVTWNVQEFNKFHLIVFIDWKLPWDP